MTSFESPGLYQGAAGGDSGFSSPTARRQAAGRPHPAPLDLSPKDASGSKSLRTASTSLSPTASPNMLSSTPPITPTRKVPSSASSLVADSSNAKTDRIFGGRGTGMERISSAQSTGSTSGGGPARGGPLGRGLSSTAQTDRGFAPSAQRRPSIIGYSVSRRTSSFHQQAGGAHPSGGGGAMSNNRFLLTVIPPSHLPHDPPHPKSNPNCSGYGPPEHFKRGTLIPLYPTLSSQLAAIAREYGLPSTGGLVLYLLSTSDPNSAVQAPLPGAAGFEGGPRISEEAWNLLWRRLFEEEEEVMILAESDDEDGYAPPVPPIPPSHRQNPSDGTSSAEPTFSSFPDIHRRGQQSSRRIASESDQAPFSDVGEQDLERTSFSSEGGDHEGSLYSAGIENGQAEGSKGNAVDQHARSAIGRGHPSSQPSPSASTRFASAPIPSGSRYSSYSQPNMRHASRQSVRSNASRFGRSSYAPSGRATAMSNYSSPQLVGEAFGAAVVVGKVEFDIDRRRGGKSKWYEGWMETASDPANSGTISGGTSSAVTSPRIRQGVEQEAPVESRSISGTAEAESKPLDIESAFPLPPSSSTRTLGGLAPSRGLRPLELSRSASPTGSMIEKPEDPMSPESVAASGYSNAAAAGHGDDESVADRARSPSLARSHSRSSSLASSLQQPSEHGYAPLADADADAAPYAQLEDDEGSNHFESGRESRQSQAESEESDYDAQVEEVERGEQEMAKRRESEMEEQQQIGHDSATTTLAQADPLGDVFPDDEATWRTFAQEPGHVDEKEMVETTGLGIVGARVLDLKANAAPGVVERSPAEVTDDEAGVPPPQDDVADVMQLLKSGQSQDKTDKVNLASPIRLDSSPTAPSNTGVFEDPSNSSFDESRPPFDDSGISFDTASGPFENQPFEPSPSADLTDLAARRRSLQRPRFGSGASARALNLVSIDVRPPSTVHSSPEYAPNRKQRQGWTNVPPVVDRSMSASTSLASLDSYEQPDSQRESTIGLMENLDDLERALADLSPTTSRRSPAIVQEEPTPEPSPRALPVSVLEPTEREPETENSVVREQEAREEQEEKTEDREQELEQDQDQELEQEGEQAQPQELEVEEGEIEERKEESSELEQQGVPEPASATPVVAPSNNLSTTHGEESPSAPVAPTPPFVSTSRSGTASPVLGSRPPFRYGASSSNVVPSSRAVTSPVLPPATLEPPPRPPRGDSLNVNTDRAEQDSSEDRPQTPSKATFEPIPLAGAFSSPEQMSSSTHVEAAPGPGDPARTPRTSSLSRGTPRSAQQVALPPSPMPPQSESAWHDAVTPTLPSHSFPSAPAPTSPRQPFISQRPPPPMPPIPTEDDVITFPDPPQRSPKSPSGFKALRNKSSWKKNKEIDIAKASATSAENGDESTKSPVTGFFAKPAFQKLGGMFNKKSGADASPDPSASPSMGGPELSSLDQQRSAASHAEAPSREQSTATPPPPEPYILPARSASRQGAYEALESSRSELVPQLPHSAPVDYSNLTTSSFAPEYPPLASETPAPAADEIPLLRPTATPLASSSYTLLPTGSSDSFRTALSSLPVRADSSSPVSPGVQSFGNITPTDVTFATSYASSSTSYTPLPPLPYDPISTDAEYSISSPRSEFGAPQTPVQGPSSGYAASAPATPAAWSQNKHALLEPGSRFGKGVASSGGRQAAKQQLSADIDQLLSQMNEIDFGGEEDAASSLAETSRTSENETTQELSPVMRSSPLGKDERLQEEDSMDVGSSLGGLMMESLPSPTLRG